MKLHNTKFWCCNEYNNLITNELISNGYDGPNRVVFFSRTPDRNKEIWPTLEYTCYLKFCPFCGNKLR